MIYDLIYLYTILTLKINPKSKSFLLQVNKLQYGFALEP